jgi:hypothetical protein
MRCDSEETAEDEIREAVRLIRVYKVLEPAKILPVVVRILAVSIDVHVDIKQNHAALP